MRPAPPCPAASSAWTVLTNWRGRRAGITVYSEATPTVTIAEVKTAARPRRSVGHCGLQFARIQVCASCNRVV